MPKTVDGAPEIMQRFAEAASQLVVSGFNAMGPTRSRALASALEAGSKVQLIVNLDPLDVECWMLNQFGEAGRVGLSYGHEDVARLGRRVSWSSSQGNNPDPLRKR